jgi:ribosomal protein L18E
MKKQLGFTAVEMVVVVVALVLAGGWIANIVKLVGMDFASITGMLVVRAAGIFLPMLGGVMGFL